MHKVVFFTLLIISCYLTLLVNCSRPALCELPSEPGNCRALMPSYYFNPLSEKCEFFIYGGCKGNANRFDTEEECTEQCGSSDGGNS